VAKGEQSVRSARRARLVAIGRPAREYFLEAPVVSIGSAPTNSIVLRGRGVASHHAEIRTPRGKSIIRDLGSPLGTLLNGARISVPVELNAGNGIQIGPHRFRFEEFDPSPRIGRMRGLALLLGLIAAGTAAYLFVSNWTMVEQAADYEQRATPSPSPRMFAALASPTLAPAVARAATASPTTSASRTPKASPTATASPVPRTALRRRLPAVYRTPARVPRMSPTLTPPIPSATPSPVFSAAAESVTPTIAPGWSTPAPIPAAASAADWLGAVNAYRAMVRLDPVTADPSLGASDFAHAKYLVRNFGAEIAKGKNLGSEMHNEDPDRPYYTAQGRDAGHQSDVNNVIEYPGQRILPAWAIDSWMAAPFHRASILNPDLKRVGYGEFCEHRVCVAALNTIAGVDSTPAGMIYDRPVEFPAPAATTGLTALFGEWPNPISGCSGYSFPSGIPITVQIGKFVDAKLGGYSLMVTGGNGAGTAVEACGFDATTYRNPGELDQAWARAGLQAMGEIVIVPRNPLQRGTSYRVTIVIDGKRYTWPFSTTP